MGVFKCSVLTVMGVFLPLGRLSHRLLLCRTANDFMLLCLLPFEFSRKQKLFSKQTFQDECGSSVECLHCA